MTEKLRERVSAWIGRDPDPHTRAELQELLAQDAVGELSERFSQRLSFGTAGLRGIMGAGPNRMNRLVVRDTSLGLGKYIQDTIGDAAQRGIVVGFDGRVGSLEFAHEAATVFSSLGLRVFLSDRPVPTPLCAFAVTHLGAAAGVVVTASHNPPEYNGYKIYWEDGAQIVPPHERFITEWIQRAAAEMPSIAAARPFEGLGANLIDAYVHAILDVLAPLASDRIPHLRLAYTPLHGVGAELATRIFKALGVRHLSIVPEQAEPDGRFPTVRFPNPEEPDAMDHVLALAQRVGADLVVANDPDADRIAVALANEAGGFTTLNGDQAGVLLADALMDEAPAGSAFGSTIVSSRMLRHMAHARGMDYFDTLTGFKWLSHEALRRRAQGQAVPLTYEEALGLSVGDVVRCKDGISAAAAFTCLVARHGGAGLLLHLQELYRRYGLFWTRQQILPLEGSAQNLIQRLLSRPPSFHRALLAVWHLDGQERRFSDGRTETTLLPKTAGVIFELDRARVIVRPSGTEPKVKCYFEVVERIATGERFADACAHASGEVDLLITELGCPPYTESGCGGSESR